MGRIEVGNSNARSRSQPVRTCVGCRERASKSELIRVVAVEGSTSCVLTPDLEGSSGGRGANLHPTVVCLDLAVRRKAFGRALRVQGELDYGLVRAHVRAVESVTTIDRTAEPTGAVTAQKRSTRS